MPDTMTARDVIAAELNTWRDCDLTDCPDSILRALREAGFAVVPREATAGMTDSGRTTLEEGKDAYHQEMMAREIYRAMVAAGEGE